MAKITINGVRPYEGNYEFDYSEFTTLEWRWIKKFSGYMPLTISDGLDGGDPDLIVVFTAIALVRAGKVERDEIGNVIERFEDVGFGDKIVLEDDEEEEIEQFPPPTSSNGNSESSGDDSMTSSVKSASIPQATGHQPWGTSPSDPVTSET